MMVAWAEAEKPGIGSKLDGNGERVVLRYYLGIVDALPRWMYNTGSGDRGLKLRKVLEIFENHYKGKAYTNHRRVREPWGSTEVLGLFSCYVLSSCFVTPWTVAHQAPLSMEFSRQEFWNGLPFLPPGNLPNPGIEPTSLALASRFFTTEPLGKCVPR